VPFAAVPAGGGGGRPICQRSCNRSDDADKTKDEEWSEKLDANSEAHNGCAGEDNRRSVVYST